MTSERIGILGGTFDPVHIGHLILGETARDEISLDRVLFIPTGHSWRKQQLAISPGSDRLAMARLATEGNAAFEVDDIEVRREGPSYTDETLEELATSHPGAELFFILGRDALLDLPNWRNPARIIELATLVVADRPDDEADDAPETVVTGARTVRLRMPALDISATDIRERIRAGRSVRYLVPDVVADYIRERGLFRN